MARRPMAPGTWGKIKVVQLSTKVFEARARFRQADGTFARPRRRGHTRPAAEEALKKALIELSTEVRSGEINRDSRMTHIATLWLTEIDRAAEAGELAPRTAYSYRGWVKNWILPRVGKLTARELEQSVMTCERVMTAAEVKTGKSTAKGVKAAFGLLCGFAVRHGAMVNNPVKSTQKIGSNKRKPVLALTLEQRLDLLAKVEMFARGKQVDKRGRDLGRRARVWRDLPDRLRARLSTGVRVSEIVAIDGSAINTQDRTVAIDHHLVWTPGRGTERMPGRKAGPDLLLRYPPWSADLWRRLKLTSGGGPVFPNAHGGWINPGQASDHETEALAACGYEWVTGHVMRKTVALVLKEGGLSVRQIADQLGTTEEVVEKYYLAKGVTNDDQAAALDKMLG